MLRRLFAKTGQFKCLAKIRVKTSKSLTDELPFSVERACAKHDHDDEHRKYAIYNHKIDDTIEEAINDGLSFKHVKKKLFKDFPSVAEDFKGSKGLR